nr:NADH dehydrogenase subunit 6 [Acanthurus leucopareius]
MMYMMAFLLLGWVFGMVAIASNPSPYFGALGLVVVAGLGCGVLVGHGGGFLSLVLFLIYLGGMLVVFAYSAALAAEPYPEGWWNRSIMIIFAVYLSVVSSVALMYSVGWSGSFSFSTDELNEFSAFCGDMGGVSLVYSAGGGVLVIGAMVLLFTLLVVLELTRGLSRGVVRAV